MITSWINVSPIPTFSKVQLKHILLNQEKLICSRDMATDTTWTTTSVLHSLMSIKKKGSDGNQLLHERTLADTNPVLRDVTGDVAIRRKLLRQK